MAYLSNTLGFVNMPCVSANKSFGNIFSRTFTFSYHIYVLVTCLWNRILVCLQIVRSPMLEKKTKFLSIFISNSGVVYIKDYLIYKHNSLG